MRQPAETKGGPGSSGGGRSHEEGSRGSSEGGTASDDAERNGTTNGGNIFFHGVYCQIVLLELQALGIGRDTQFHQLQIESKPASEGDDCWDGVRRRYYWSDTYYLPLATRPAAEASGSQAGGNKDEKPVSALEEGLEAWYSFMT